MPANIPQHFMFPILLIDTVGFTSIYNNEDQRAVVTQKLTDMLDQAGESISPVIPLTELFTLHGTGDGFYLIMDKLTAAKLPLIRALELAQRLRKQVKEYNQTSGLDLPLAVRLVLDYGEVKMVGKQYAGAVLSQANRLIDDKGFKKYQKASDEPSALFASMLFNQALQDELKTRSPEFPELAALAWQRVEIKDKHKDKYTGFVQGEATLVEAVFVMKKPPDAAKPDGTGIKQPSRTGKRTNDNNDKLLSNHREAILREHSRIRLLGYISVMNIHVNLLEVFVHLRLTPTEALPTGLTSIKMRENDSDILTPTDLLPRVQGKQEILLILGGPGSGKTTMLQYFAVNCCDAEGRQRIHLEHPLIPLFIPLREIVKGFQPDSPFILTLAAWLQQHNLMITPEIVEGWLRDPGCLVLLDGLDEVGDQGMRQEICNWIDSAFTSYAQSLFMVTCRFTGYRVGDGVALQSPVIQVEVRDFHPEQQQTFLQQWFQAVEIAGADRDRNHSPTDRHQVSTEAGKQAIAVMNYLNEEKNRSLRELAGTPMLLQIMAIIWKERHSLSGHRVPLYDECMKYLLEYRDKYKNIQPLLTADQACSVLQPLALWLQRDKKSDQATKTEVEHHLAERIFQVKPTLKPADFLDNIRERAGVLVGAIGADAYTFQHKTFREYLAAIELARDKSGVDLLVRNFNDDWWRETLLFSAGMTRPEIFPAFIGRFLGDKQNDGSTPPLLLEMLREAVAKPLDSIIAAIRNQDLTWQQRYNALRCLQSCDLGESARAKYPELITDLSAESAHELRPVIAELLRSWEVKLSSDNIAASNVFIVPFEDRAEYILIPGGSYEYSVTKKRVNMPDLYVARYPVTNKRYELFLQSLQTQQAITHRSRLADDHRFNGPDQPVVGINWYSAIAYCEWVTNEWHRIKGNTKQTIFHLPTEIEWEWAASGDNREYPWGKEAPDKSRANYGSMVGQTTPVGSYPSGATPEGLMDMAGNVWEWCSNKYAEPMFEFAGSMAKWRKFTQDNSEDNRALRGGSWSDASGYCRCACRLSYWSYGSWSSFGLRVVVRDL